MKEETRLHKQAAREREQAAAHDTAAGLDLCRSIRDDRTAANADRLRVVALIETLKANGL